MNKLQHILTAGIFLLSFLFTESTFADSKVNRLFDINISTSEKDITYLFELSGKPFFLLEPSSDKRLSLSFRNTDKPDELRTKIEKIPSIVLDTTGEFENANFILTPDNPYGKIDCVWLNEKSIFAIKILYNTEEDKKKDVNNNNPSIKDIRFGFKESGTRMVIGANSEPHWAIKSLKNGNLSLMLDASSKKIKTKSFNSGKWLRQVEIKEYDDKHSELSIDVKSDPNQVGIFWGSE